MHVPPQQRMPALFPTVQAQTWDDLVESKAFKSHRLSAERNQALRRGATHALLGDIASLVLHIARRVTCTRPAALGTLQVPHGGQA